MTIKTVTFDTDRIFSQEDCVVIKSSGNIVTLAFPFHEDTPNFHLTITDALNLRNALDEVIKQKFLNAPMEVI